MSAADGTNATGASRPGTNGARPTATAPRASVTELLDPAFAPANDPAVRALVEATAMAVPAGVRPLEAPAPEHDELPLDAAEAPLRRYLRYQVRDFALYRGSFLVVMAMIGLYLAWYVTRFAAGAPQPIPPSAFLEMSVVAMSLFTGLGVTLSTYGLVARERERGQQRFLFAKPVGVVPYYLQKLAVALGGFLLVALVLVLLAGLVFGQPVDLPLVMGAVSALAIMGGGTAFLLSTLFRYDSPIAGILAVANIPLWVLTHEATLRFPVLRTIGQLHWVLPPLHAIEAFVDTTPMSGLSPLTAWLWMVGYGLACIAGGVAVLRRRSITT